MKIEEAKLFIKGCVKQLGIGFHPCILFSDYINSNGNSVFTDDEAMEMQHKLDMCFEIDGFDPEEFVYDIVMNFHDEN